VPAVTEAACLGTALLAGVGAGVYADLGEAVRLPEGRVVPDVARYRLYRELYPTLIPL
jgi:sugar (pentulose or hexulose) kinase